jgi:hypothetical protein
MGDTDAPGVEAQAASGSLAFECSDVTGTQTVAVSDVHGAAPAGAVAKALASRMALPDNVPWSLRDDASGKYLEDDAAIGEQVTETGARLTVIPKTHLG